jgi:hypothetical protein
MGLASAVARPPIRRLCPPSGRPRMVRPIHPRLGRPPADNTRCSARSPRACCSRLRAADADPDESIIASGMLTRLWSLRPASALQEFLAGATLRLCHQIV